MKHILTVKKLSEMVNYPIYFYTFAEQEMKGKYPL